ncbi:unnamed protein product [Symbiodinium necroappetens]|uniref:Uncharacterized protein n=1 Tax=Symbiodinium necroappetens TaxID=1628268 RepID=A0A812JS07_9DINO|nr:unnamed protein product [Symbiodinium necroappetens]
MDHTPSAEHAGDSALQGDGQNAPPTAGPALCRGRAQRGWGALDAKPEQDAKELLALVAPAAPDLSGEPRVEQGDPLAPGLYALGQHDSLVAASASLHAGEGEVERGAGVEANLGKTRVYNAAGGDAPLGIAALGPDVWCGDLPPARRGFVALGVPIGHPDFLGAHAAGRLEAEADLLHCRICSACPIYRALGFCWPTAQRLGRNTCFATSTRRIYCLTPAPTTRQSAMLSKACLAARAVAFLPLFRGLGLLSAERVSSAAYWAAWADALPVLRARYPEVADGFVHELEGEPARSRRGLACEQQHLPRTGSLKQAGKLDRIGTLVPVAQAVRPSTENSGSGAPVGSDTPFSHSTLPFENACCYQPCDSGRSSPSSQSGPHAGMWLAAIPSDAASTLPPDLMHVALRRRLRLPLPLTGRRCGAQGRHGCGAEVDAYGDQPAGLLPRRGFVVERAWVQVSKATWGAWARAATLTAKVKASRVRNASPTWRVNNTTSAGGRNWVTSEPTVRSGCAGRRCGSVSAWSVSASPGARAAAVSVGRARESSPRLTRAQAAAKRLGAQCVEAALRKELTSRRRRAARPSGPDCVERARSKRGSNRNSFQARTRLPSYIPAPLRNTDRVECSNERFADTCDDEARHGVEGWDRPAKLCRKVDVIEPSPSILCQRDRGTNRAGSRGSCHRPQPHRWQNSRSPLRTRAVPGTSVSGAAASSPPASARSGGGGIGRRRCEGAARSGTEAVGVDIIPATAAVHAGIVVPLPRSLAKGASTLSPDRAHGGEQRARRVLWRVGGVAVRRCSSMGGYLGFFPVKHSRAPRTGPRQSPSQDAGVTADGDGRPLHVPVSELDEIDVPALAPHSCTRVRAAGSHVGASIPRAAQAARNHLSWASVQPSAAQTGHRMPSGVSDWRQAREHVGWRTAEASAVAEAWMGSGQIRHTSAGGVSRERSDSCGVCGGVSSITVTAAEVSALPPGGAWAWGLRRAGREASR